MSFVLLSEQQTEQLERELQVRGKAEGADSAVAIAEARERLAAYLAARIGEANGGGDALHRALTIQANAARSLGRARAVKRLALRRLVRVRGLWRSTP